MSTLPFALTKIWFPVCKPNPLYTYFKRNCASFLVPPNFYFNMTSRTTILSFVKSCSFEVYAAMFYDSALSLLVSNVAA